MRLGSDFRAGNLAEYHSGKMPEMKRIFTTYNTAGLNRGESFQSDVAETIGDEVDCDMKEGEDE